MHEAAGAPPQLTDGVCGAAQSTGAAASRPILQARPLALRLHRERAIVAKNTDLCVADLHGGRAQRRDNRRPRMLARKRTRRASCRPGGGRPSSPPERHAQGQAWKGCFSVRVCSACVYMHHGFAGLLADAAGAEKSGVFQYFFMCEHLVLEHLVGVQLFLCCSQSVIAHPGPPGVF